MTQFTDSDETEAKRMGVLLEHPDVLAAERERNFATELALVANARASQAEGRARIWKRRCLVFAVLLAGALAVIEAMAVGWV